MQHSIHPKYHKVVFEDTSCNKRFLINSCLQSKQEIEWEDGKKYPHVIVDVSSASHPFYTGGKRTTGAEGRIAKFQKRFSMKVTSKNKSQN